MTSDSYKQTILDLNYCLFNQLAATTLVRNDSLTMLNPRNPGHQQSNLSCRFRFGSENNKEQFITFVTETVKHFHSLGLQPRFFVDELATPSLDTLATWFESEVPFRVNVERDTDIIMACTFDDYNKHATAVVSSPLLQAVKATVKDVEGIAQLNSASFGYGDNVDWLRYKLTTQLNDPQTSVYVLKDNTDKQVFTTFAILNVPDGLPHLMHVNVCGTHPDHQRQGLGLACLQQALRQELRPGQTAYLEVYEEISHAQRMYERVGFKALGTSNYATVTLP